MQSSQITAMIMLTLACAPRLACAAENTHADTGANGVYRGHALAMHGDLKYGPDFRHFAYADPRAPKGGTLRMSALHGFDSFNSFIVRGRPAAWLGLMYDSLMVGSADEAFSQYGLIARSVEVPRDRTWIIYNLRAEARWHDGHPLTADDVVFTFNLRMKKGRPWFRFYYRSVKEVRKLGPHRVKFVFKGKGNNRELPLIVGQMQILPRHYWQNRDFAATTLKPPLGSGPYRIKTFEANRFIVYERVRDYWARDLGVRKGFFNFDRIRFDYFRDSVVTLQAFKAGKFDIRFENTSKYWATAYNIPAVKSGAMLKLEIPHHRSSGMYGFIFNTRKKIFRDRQVRLAISHALDFEWTNRKLFYSAYTRARSFFGNCELEARGLPRGRELRLLRDLAREFPDAVPAEVFTREYNPPSTGEWNTEREHKLRIRANLLAATGLLRKAGWHVRRSDMRLVNPEYRDGNGDQVPFTFEILLVSPGQERVALPFARTLKRLGIRARVRTVDSAQYRKRITDFDYDMIIAGWGQSLSPGNEQRNYWSSRAAAMRGSRNYCGINNPAIDKAINLVIQAPDRASLVARTRVLDRLLQWGYYLIPNWFIPYDRIACWNKFGRPKITPDSGSSIMTWWVKPDKGSDDGE